MLYVCTYLTEAISVIEASLTYASIFIRIFDREPFLLVTKLHNHYHLNKTTYIGGHEMGVGVRGTGKQYSI